MTDGIVSSYYGTLPTTQHPVYAPNPVAYGTATSLFSDSDSQGVVPVTTEQVYDPETDTYHDIEAPRTEDASPESVAGYVKSPPYPGSNNVYADRDFFIQALEQHAGDTEWLAGFYDALGPEKSRELIRESLFTDGYHNTSLSTDAVLTTLRGSLETLVGSGQFDAGTLATILDDLGSGPEGIQYLAIDVFGASGDQALKNLFIDYALARNEPLWDTAATHVLDASDQQAQIDYLRTLGGEGNRLEILIRNAMTGRTELSNFSDAANLAHYGADLDTLEQVTFGNIASLLEVANDVQVNYYAHTTSPLLPPRLQLRILDTVVTTLGDSGAKDAVRGDTAFKEALGDLFIDRGDRLLKENTVGAEGYVIGGDNPDSGALPEQLRNGLVGFFEVALFEEHPADNREALMIKLLETTSGVSDLSSYDQPPGDVGSTAVQNSYAAYAEAHNGWWPGAHVRAIAELQAAVYQAASNQKGRIEEEIAADTGQREALVGFLTGMAFAFVPGAGTYLKPLLKSPNSLHRIAGTIAEYSLDHATGGAQTGLVDILTELGATGDDRLTDIDSFLGNLRSIMSDTRTVLPAGSQDGLDLVTPYEAVFGYYGFLQ